MGVAQRVQRFKERLSREMLDLRLELVQSALQAYQKAIRDLGQADPATWFLVEIGADGSQEPLIRVQIGNHRCPLHSSRCAAIVPDNATRLRATDTSRRTGAPPVL